MKSKGLKERERRMKAGINNAESEKEVGMKEVNCLKRGKEQGNEKERAKKKKKRREQKKGPKQKVFVKAKTFCFCPNYPDTNFLTVLNGASNLLFEQVTQYGGHIFHIL